MIRKATENDIAGVARIYDAIHTLEEQGKVAHEQGCTVLRMDTQKKNVAVRRLYAHLGYTEADIIDCDFQPGISGICLVLLEKTIMQENA